MSSSPATISTRELKRRALRLEAWLFSLVILVAFLPPTIFTLLELRRARERTAEEALYLAMVVRDHLRERGAAFEQMSGTLADRLEPSGWPRGLQILDAEGAELLRVGSGRPSWSPLWVRRELPEDLSPIAEVGLGVDAAALARNALRVQGIHLIVAAALGLAIWRLPVRSLNQAIAHLESAQGQIIHSERLSALGEVYAGLAHEINNPLGVILTRVELIRSQERERPLDPETAEDLVAIERQGRRIDRLVRGLLGFARKASFDTRHEQVNVVIQEVLEMVEQPFARKKVILRVDLAPALPRVDISRVHLQQVLVNLLNNARDAMPDGGVVHVRSLLRKGRVEIQVEDAGPGLDEVSQARVFEPFFTTKANGTGLGLSVSHGIVQAHGGEISVESPPGRGALFTIRLPHTGAGG